MVNWFTISLVGFIVILVPYWLSLEHGRLEDWFGENSRMMGNILGIISGWGFFGFWIGLWISPQTRFLIGYELFTAWDIKFTPVNIGGGLLLLAPAVYIGIKAVTELGLKTSETHRSDKLVTTGLYGVVRHPQYLAGVLGHFGVSLFLGSRDALLATPVVLLAVYILCWKEEKELVKEYGRQYIKYQKEVPMFIPRR
jgi:protein-S-isoprenylcysteine O-methyltransferase Ste14